MREVACEQLEDDLVDGVQEVNRPVREGLVDERHGQAVLALADAGRKHGPRWLEARVLIAQVEELFENGYEPAEVGAPPLAARAFALLDDGVDRRVSTGEICDGLEFGEPEVPRCRLGARRPEEQPRLTDLLSQVVETDLDRAIELADRREILEARPDLVLGREG